MKLRDAAELRRLVRYIVSGGFATAVHFAVLVFNLHVLGIPVVGVANGLAACAGIFTSFLGSKYYVFQNHSESLSTQGFRFLFLYAGIAGLHAVLLFVWSDMAGLDYRYGFVVATLIQVVSSYWGNRVLVFRVPQQGGYQEAND